jgi:hypothetical protein
VVTVYFQEEWEYPLHIKNQNFPHNRPWMPISDFLVRNEHHLPIKDKAIPVRGRGGPQVCFLWGTSPTGQWDVEDLTLCRQSAGNVPTIGTIWYLQSSTPLKLRNYQIIKELEPSENKSEIYFFRMTNFKTFLKLCKIWSFHGGEYEEWRLLGCYAM